MTATQQEMRAFYDPTPDRRFPHLPPPPSDALLRARLSPLNPKLPLNKILVSKQNQKNFDSIHLMCYSIMQKWNRNPRGNNFGMYCPPGQGKTFIIKKIAETLEICFVFIQSEGCDNTYILFEEIRAECQRYGTPIVPYKTKDADYLLPPMIVFFDEAHKLPMPMMKGGLLNAMEPDDCIMAVREPGKRGASFRVNCWNVCWCAATTDRGDLFDAFEQRLLNPIKWSPATEEELPKIIKSGMDKKLENGDILMEMPLEACALVPKFVKVPRLAIHRFGLKVVQRKQYAPKESWEAACQYTADMFGIDKWGLDQQQVAVLKALGQRPIAEGRLGTVCGCRSKEVSKFVLPGLQQYYDGGPFVQTVSGRGMCITRSGLEQLEKRGIDHGGEKVTAEYFEERR